MSIPIPLKRALSMIFILASTGCLSLVSAQGTSDLLGQMREAYRAQDFVRAAALAELSVLGGDDSAKSLFRAGMLLHRSGDLEAAARYYYQVVERYPRSDYISEASKNLDRIRPWMDLQSRLEAAQNERLKAELKLLKEEAALDQAHTERSLAEINLGLQ